MRVGGLGREKLRGRRREEGARRRERGHQGTPEPRWGPEKGAHGRGREERAKEGAGAGWGPECCISGGGAKLRSWPFPSRSRREGGPERARCSRSPCLATPSRVREPFSPRSSHQGLVQMPGKAAGQLPVSGSGPSGHCSVSPAPITGTWTWLQGPLEEQKGAAEVGAHSQEGSARPRSLGLSPSVQGCRDGSDSGGVCSPPAVLQICRMKAKGWLLTATLLLGVWKEEERKAPVDSLEAGLRVLARQRKGAASAWHRRKKTRRVPRAQRRAVRSDPAGPQPPQAMQT